ncbi:unnamed protein product [Heterobilharzia americana]|nr:unnamed protein product [Heterobilharzia americana]CAH8616800.1 unnamed protein product [Heterobilharzia americana]
MLRRALKTVSRVSGVSLAQLINTVVDRHINSCKLLTTKILTDSEHPLYLQLSPCISSRRTRGNYIRLYARTAKYKNSTVPYLARIFCEEKSVRTEITHQLCDS